MKSFLEFLYESKKSDQYEIDVADTIQAYSDKNKLGWKSERPVASVSYSDVKVTTDDGKTSWIEVKMNETDNLGTPRFFYEAGKWQSNMHTVIAKDICKMLDASADAKKFIEDLAKFTKIPKEKLYLSPYKSEIVKAEKPDMVTLEQLKAFAKARGGRYILKQNYTGIASVVAAHYLKGKQEPTQYIQIGDNFCQFNKNENPLGFSDVPILKGDGVLNIRFSTRSQFYEIVSEIKFKKLAASPVSFMPGTEKPAPTVTK